MDRIKGMKKLHSLCHIVLCMLFCCLSMHMDKIFD